MTTNLPKNPFQPTITDEHGVIRFKSNKLVVALIVHAQRTGLSLNDLRERFHAAEDNDDWTQLSQLDGYSVSGWGGLSHVSDEAYYKQQTEMKARGNGQVAYIEHLENQLKNLRAALREPIATLYGISPDDLAGN